MRNCVDEGMLQGYIDGELSPALMDEVAVHIAACAACADAAREAEAELAMFSTAFAPETSLNVPTERLRERLDAAIAGIKTSEATPKTSRFNQFFGALAALFTLTPQRAAAFASLALVITFAVLFVAVRPRTNMPETTGSGDDIAAVKPAEEKQNVTVAETTVQPPANVEPNKNVASAPENSGDAVFVKAGANKTRGIRRATNSTKATGGRKLTTPEQKLLPGEETYLEAIASLTKAIDAGGDTLLRPSVRSDYERSLAVVDQAILTTRRNALSNPKDADAKEFLFSAYQTKVELLNTVADQTQTATLGR